MSNDEARKTKHERMSKLERLRLHHAFSAVHRLLSDNPPDASQAGYFGFCHSDFFRHSSFVLRHCSFPPPIENSEGPIPKKERRYMGRTCACFLFFLLCLCGNSRVRNQPPDGRQRLSIYRSSKPGSRLSSTTSTRPRMRSSSAITVRSSMAR